MSDWKYDGDLVWDMYLQPAILKETQTQPSLYVSVIEIALMNINLPPPITSAYSPHRPQPGDTKPSI